MGVENYSSSVDEYANQCVDPVYLMSIPPPSTGGGEGAGDPVVPSPKKDSYAEIPSKSDVPFAGYWNHFADASIHPVQRGIAGAFLPVMAPLTVAAGFLSSPFGCATENNDHTLQPEDDAPGGNEGEDDGPEQIPPPKDATQPDLVVADGNDLVKDPDAGVGDDDAAVGDDDAAVGDDDGGDDDGAVDGGDDDGGDPCSPLPVAGEGEGEGECPPVDTDSDGDTFAADVDCNDNDATVHQNLYGYADIDGDGYTVGPLQALCSGAGLSAGFRAVSLGEDCDDSNAALYQNLTAYTDIDDDEYTVGGEQTLCSGAALAAGYSETTAGEDCDDLDFSINPSATEFAYDGIDQDCDGGDLVDVDGDGVAAVAAGGADCDDNNLAIYPGAVETPYNGVDEDCNGGDITDVDGDGFDALAVVGGTDCNDDLAYIKPGVEQRLNGIDTNCDGNLEIDLARDAVKIIVGGYEGAGDGGQAGRVMAFGDVNGDGFDDVIVSSPTENSVFYIFGGDGDLLPGNVLEMPVDADSIIRFSAEVGVGLGAAIAVTDLDGDGKDDSIIGAGGLNDRLAYSWYGEGNGSDTGAIYIFYGRDIFDAEYTLNYTNAEDPAFLASSGMAMIKGDEGEGFPIDIFATGDMDGNGSGEIVAGKFGNCNIIPALPYAGIQTKADIIASEGGYHLFQMPDTYLPGWQCSDSVFGDIDGDGLTDIVTADTDDDEFNGAGKIFTIFGSDSLPAEINVATLASYEGLRYMTFRGNGPNYYAGDSLSVGDVDGDGKAEVVIGVYQEDTFYDDIPVSNPGKVYIVPGSSIADVVNGLNPAFPNGSDVVLDGPVFLIGGTAIYGNAADVRLSAFGVSAEGDANSDGLNDLIVGAGWLSRGFYFDGTTLTGMATDEISSSEAEHQMIGTESGNFGMWLRGGADVNGDGASDTFINDRLTDGARGITYLFCGGPGN